MSGGSGAVPLAGSREPPVLQAWGGAPRRGAPRRGEHEQQVLGPRPWLYPLLYPGCRQVPQPDLLTALLRSTLCRCPSIYVPPPACLLRAHRGEFAGAGKGPGAEEAFVPLSGSQQRPQCAAVEVSGPAGKSKWESGFPCLKVPPACLWLWGDLSVFQCMLCRAPGLWSVTQLSWNQDRTTPAPPGPKKVLFGSLCGKLLQTVTWQLGPAALPWLTCRGNCPWLLGASC